MKSCISKALLGLCLIAPSAMALLPKLPGKYAGIFIDANGFNSTQRTALNNGMGLWLIGMRGNFNSTTAKYRVVAYPEAPNTVATITIEKVNAPATRCTGGTDPRICAVDISYSYQGKPNNGRSTYDNVAITIYTQNAQGGSNGLPLGNSVDDQISFQNFATYLSMLALKPTMTADDVFVGEFDLGSRQVVVPNTCGLETAYNSGACAVSMGSPIYKDGLVPMLTFKQIDNAGRVVAYSTRMHMLGSSWGQGTPNWILTTARYALSNAAAGGKSVEFDDGNGSSSGPLYANRIIVGTNTGADAPCFTGNQRYVGLGYSVASNPTSGPIGNAANAGLNVQTISRVSTSAGDAISGTYPQSCQTTIGMVADFLLGG